MPARAGTVECRVEVQEGTAVGDQKVPELLPPAGETSLVPVDGNFVSVPVPWSVSTDVGVGVGGRPDVGIGVRVWVGFGWWRWYWS